MDNNQLPIDIHLSKLLDWILDRRHCQRDWQKNVLPIRNKINLAIQDMPEHDEITNLLTGSSIHYFNCLKIVEILKETEKNSKNIFGMYSSQRMKDWNTIVSAYQKNNIYLAEAASVLQRNVAYEIPALKKQINKCQTQHDECEEKHSNSLKSITEINLQIKQLCSELGIQGENISKELKELPNQLVEVYQELTKKCANLEKTFKFYCSYVEHFFGRKEAESLPMLGYLIRKGNTTVYEWRTGSEPKTIERLKQLEHSFGDEENSTNNEDKIDFGDFEAKVDLDIDLNTQNNEGEIDWGDFNVETSSPATDLPADIDLEALKNEISIEGAGVYIPSDGIAKDTDALNVLEWTDTRNLLLLDLQKLDTFLRQKYHEMKSDSDNLLVSTILQDAPKTIQTFTEKDVQKSIDLVKDTLSYFKVKKVEQLLRINDSPKYLKRLYDQFQSKKKSIERCIKNQQLLKERQKELTKEETELNEKLKLIIKKSKELQKYICEDLSKKYNGVRINIMGEINLL